MALTCSSRTSPGREGLPANAGAPPAPPPGRAAPTSSKASAADPSTVPVSSTPRRPLFFASLRSPALRGRGAVPNSRSTNRPSARGDSARRFLFFMSVALAWADLLRSSSSTRASNISYAAICSPFHSSRYFKLSSSTTTADPLISSRCCTSWTRSPMRRPNCRYSLREGASLGEGGPAAGPEGVGSMPSR